MIDLPHTPVAIVCNISGGPEYFTVGTLKRPPHATHYTLFIPPHGFVEVLLKSGEVVADSTGPVQVFGAPQIITLPKDFCS
jgi:hypothetical protein